MVSEERADNIWHISGKSESNIGQRNKLNGSDLYDMRCMMLLALNPVEQCSKAVAAC